MGGRGREREEKDVLVCFDFKDSGLLI